MIYYMKQYSDPGVFGEVPAMRSRILKLAVPSENQAATRRKSAKRKKTASHTILGVRSAGGEAAPEIYRTLTRMGMSVLYGDAAGRQPDAVIIDLDHSGLDSVLDIRQKHPHLPILAVTSCENRLMAIEALKTGVWDYLIKPVSGKLVLDVMEHLTGPNKSAGELPPEKRVMGVMVPIMEYTTLLGNQSVKHAIEMVRQSFREHQGGGRILETGHRSLLVMDIRGQVCGILTIRHLLECMVPGYLTDPRVEAETSLCFSPLFWKGRFTKRIRQMAEVKVKDIMDDPPPVIEGTRSLFEAAALMLQKKTRRLVVIHDGEVIGVIREQDLFFEMARILQQEK